MILMFLFVHGLVDLLINLVDLILNHKIRQIRQITVDFHQDYLQLLHLLVEKEQERWIDRVNDRVRDHHYQSLNFFHIPMTDGDDDQPPQTGRQRQRSSSRERSYPHAQVPQGPQVQPMIIQEPVTDPDEDPTVNPSSSTGLSPPVEQRERSRRRQRSRSRELTPPHTPSQAGQQPQHVVPPPGEPQIQPLASQDTDEESETVEPQSRIK